MGDAGEVNGVAIVDYAAYNEFGTSNIPARPFMSRTADENRQEIEKFGDFLAGEIVDGRKTVLQALTSLGLDYQAKIQMMIRNAKVWATPLSEQTIKMKGSTSPLIDMGRMIGAVRYVIRK